MSSVENKEFIRAVFEQMALCNGRALTDAMGDECRWVFPGNWSWSGTWAPKNVVVHELLRPLMAQFVDGYRMEADLILGDGDRVVVQARGYGITRAGGEYRQTYCFLFTVVEGRIVEVVEHCDTALVEGLLRRVVRAA
ncbi:nuclear transport factor 2 family protein [Nocardia sp. CDC153]|uniref:nuclear transport factor 2 family protein n=1 Tax=Nocardia sp. CDC153 TaxID=3112167 RepID=UPI002DBDD5A9|nr:nuclear transport factor 2 family protein [Nocardia sp. CDC153]MEC3955061.1 nuclear transport factor 2 family protein [Nocardia sp. CDC153]